VEVELEDELEELRDDEEGLEERLDEVLELFIGIIWGVFLLPTVARMRYACAPIPFFERAMICIS
jgi:hypothetical protein